MNNQLIKDNRDVFEHWLNSGSLLFKPHDSYCWYWDESLNDWCHVGTYIINDEYVEYRKAQAEGKLLRVIQKGMTSEYHYNILNSDPYNNSCNTDIDFEKYDYRVESDKPRFKIGDWVKDAKGVYCQVLSVHNGGVSYNTSDGHGGYLESGYIMENNILPWEPQVGDWVIPHSSISIFSFSVFRWEEGWQGACQPFVGSLPKLKDQ